MILNEFDRSVSAVINPDMVVELGLKIKSSN